jgi:hypothetical protein
MGEVYSRRVPFVFDFSGCFLVVLRIQVRRKTRELNDQLAERKKIEEILYLVNESCAVLRGDDLLARSNRQPSTIYLPTDFPAMLTCS